VPEPLRIVLPPSETKRTGGERQRPSGAFDQPLRRPRATVRAGLKELLANGDSHVIGRVMNARGDLLERGIATAKQTVTGRGLVLPAWQRYEGVVWGHLAPAELTDEQRSRILIPSGLYGLNGADDLIEDYRLTMKVSLPEVGSLASFWRDAVMAQLAGVEGHLVNLLPKEHEVASGVLLLPSSKVTTVAFVQAGGTGAAGHDAKAVKGIVASVLLQKGWRGLRGFTWRGWRAEEVEQGWQVVAPAKVR